MGSASVVVNSPKNYLQKHSKEPKLPEKTNFKYPDEATRRPRVPAHTDCPQMGAKSTRDFISTNAVSTIMSVARKSKPVHVDKEVGTRHALENSGLIPKYCKKKDYGKTPSYLVQHKKEMTQAQEEYDQYVTESLRQGQMEQVAEMQRNKLLEGLKKNWEELHRQYQGLSVVTDTVAKKARKERMEADMKQLEKDIELIERHKVIYIAQD